MTSRIHPNTEPTTAPLMQVQGLHAQYQRECILHDIHLQIPAASVTVIVGPNGCGKSTLLRCLARLHRISSGKILLGDQDLWGMRPKQVALQLAHLPQAPQAPAGISVEQLLRYGRHPHQGLLRQWSEQDQNAVQAAMAAVGVSELAGRRLEELSGGQRQRCWLAMSLAQETPILLLDEPTSMLDMGHQLDVLQRCRSLARAGRAVVLVLHDISAAARYADSMIALHGGRILAQGHPQQLLTPELLRQLYGVHADILRTPQDGSPVIVPNHLLPNAHRLNKIA